MNGLFCKAICLCIDGYEDKALKFVSATVVWREKCFQEIALKGDSHIEEINSFPQIIVFWPLKFQFLKVLNVLQLQSHKIILASYILN